MPSSYHFGPYRLDAGTRSLYRDDHLVSLPPKVIDVLLLLVAKGGEVVSKEQFFSTVWPESIVEESNLTQSVFVLRKTLAEGSGDQSYIETVPKRGYRFVAPVSETSDPPAQVPKRRQMLWWGAGGAIAAAAAGTAALISSPRGQETQPVAVAVLPFENLSGDAAQEYLADGLTADLTNDLGKVSSFRVRSRNSSRRHKNSSKPAQEIARELGATTLVEGSVTRAGDRIRVNCQLVEGAKGTMLWSRSYESPVKDLPLLLSEIAASIAEQVRVRVSNDEQRRLSKPGSIHADALEAYLRGRYFLERYTIESLTKADALFKDALRIDPNYAAAYCGLAETYNSLAAVEIAVSNPRESRAMAIGLARQALAIDPDRAEAHAALARSYLFEWEWAEADKAIRQALRLNPSCMSARYTNSTMLAATGRLPEALREANLSREYDPLSISSRLHVIHVTRLSRRFEEALAAVNRLVEVEPGNPGVLLQAGQINLDSGRLSQAVSCFEKMVTLSGGKRMPLGFLAQAYAAAGRRAEATAILQELLDYRKKHYLTPCILALTNLSLKNHDEFFRWFDRSFEERSTGMFWSGVETFYDSVRHERRFQEIQALIFRRGGANA